MKPLPYLLLPLALLVVGGCQETPTWEPGQSVRQMVVLQTAHPDASANPPEGVVSPPDAASTERALEGLRTRAGSASIPQPTGDISISGAD